MVYIGKRLAPVLRTDPPDKEGREKCKTDVFQLVGGAKASATALLLPDNISIEDWVKIGDALHRYETGVQWWLGDWWHYGAHKYGDRIKRVAKGIFNYQFGTLANYGYVAGRIKPSLRNEALTLSHHYQVAKFEPPEQKKWLDRAARCHWSTRDLQSKIKEKERPLTDETGARDQTATRERLKDNFLAAAAKAEGLADDARPIEKHVEQLSDEERTKLFEAATKSAQAWSAVAEIVAPRSVELAEAAE
jgi:hypothetical protein